VRSGLDGDDRGSTAMTGLCGAVDLTRRRGDAEEDAEKKQAIHNLRPQRKRRDVVWRRQPCSHVDAVDRQSQSRMVTNTVVRRPRISADSVISGFDFLRVSVSPRQMDCRQKSDLTRIPW
jgi:hypothetical protein